MEEIDGNAVLAQALKEQVICVKHVTKMSKFNSAMIIVTCHCHCLIYPVVNCYRLNSAPLDVATSIIKFRIAIHCKVPRFAVYSDNLKRDNLKLCI